MDGSGFDHAATVADCDTCDDCRNVRLQIVEHSLDIVTGRGSILPGPGAIQARLDRCTSVQLRDGIKTVVVGYGRGSKRELIAPLSDANAVRGIIRTRAFQFFRYLRRDKLYCTRGSFYEDNVSDDAEGEHSGGHNLRDLRLDLTEALRSLTDDERRIAELRFALRLPRREITSSVWSHVVLWVDRIEREQSTHAYSAPSRSRLGKRLP